MPDGGIAEPVEGIVIVGGGAGFLGCGGPWSPLTEGDGDGDGVVIGRGLDCMGGGDGDGAVAGIGANDFWQSCNTHPFNAIGRLHAFN